MGLTDEEIAKILTKDVSCKSILLDEDNIDQTIEQYLLEGWELVNKVSLQNRYKVTFRKVK